MTIVLTDFARPRLFPREPRRNTIQDCTPEQFERLPLDARTDMYSLGCIYYTMLTQKHPFDGQTGPDRSMI